MIGGAAGSELLEGLARLTDNHHILQTRNLVIIIEETGQNSAFELGLLLKRGLVGLIAEQDVSDSDFISDLLLEFRNNATFNRLPLLGHNHYLCHQL